MFLGLSNDVSPLSLYTWSSVVSVLTVAKSNSVPMNRNIHLSQRFPRASEVHEKLRQAQNLTGSENVHNFG